MHRLISHSLQTLLLLTICGAIVWAMVGPEEAGIYHNPLAAVGLGLIGLGLCRSEHHREQNAPQPASVPTRDRSESR